MKFIDKNYINTGLELEMEFGDTIPAMRTRSIENLTRETSWIAGRDDSLKNNGVEFKYRSPLHGKAIDTSLGEMSSILKNLGITNNILKLIVSDRTGYHIHLDTSKVDTPQIFNILLGFIIMERFLFASTEEPRGFSPFSQKIGQSKLVGSLISTYKYMEESIKETKSVHKHKIKKEKLNGYLKGQMRDYLFDICGQWPKYASITPRPILDIGTIEIRLMANYPHPIYLKNWIVLCHSIYKYFGEKELLKNNELDLLYDTTSNPMQFITELLNNHTSATPFFCSKVDSNQLRNLLQSGIQDIYANHNTADNRKKEKVPTQENEVRAPTPGHHAFTLNVDMTEAEQSTADRIEELSWGTEPMYRIRRTT